MSLSAPTLGILVTVPSDRPEFKAFVDIATQNLRQGQRVYAYLIDAAVEALEDPSLQVLRDQGLILHACALAATRRDIPNSESAVFSGLVTLGELIARCDRFMTFSPESGV